MYLHLEGIVGKTAEPNDEELARQLEEDYRAMAKDESREAEIKLWDVASDSDARLAEGRAE
jgi:hypothetical protein